MDSIEKLTEIFKEFPGIGERQARRFVYFLMGRNGDYALRLSKLISNLKKEITQCKDCFRFFLIPTRVDGKNDKLCKICGGVNVDS